ncbi:amino acid carrier protein [Hyphococcus formosus]|uniref:alanine/glycine:cation symporter family protein n=1 Tax=Hyphococcus formosus TaxID=3143534 RepID=UPI00398A596A
MLVSVIETVVGIIWGPPLLILLFGFGLFLTIRLRFFPITSIGGLFRAHQNGKRTIGDGDISPIEALMTGLSSTVGTGNVAGVAVALSMGGPGAIFWMWMTALLGAACSYTETVLAVMFREKGENQEYQGGPMYYMEKGIGRTGKVLALLFASAGVLASLGTGAAIQAHSIADVFKASFGLPNLFIGVVLAFATGVVIIGGISRIAKAALLLTPIMAIAYIVGACTIIFLNADRLPDAFISISQGAFGYDAAIGGFSGVMFLLALQRGAARGFFSNEAGQGTTPMIYASAKGDNPSRHGTYAATGVLFDTIVVCSMTALAILTSGIFDVGCSMLTPSADAAVSANCKTGAALTAAAFEAGLPGIGETLVSVCLLLFAWTTILGWSIYGERCSIYVFGVKSVTTFRWFWIASTLFGALGFSTFVESNVVATNAFWLLMDLLTGMMAIPNLVALLFLWPLVVRHHNPRS